MSRIRALIVFLGTFMLVSAIGIGIAGYIDQYVKHIFICPISLFLKDYYANLSTSLLFTAVTILIVDVIYGLRDTEREKQSLIFDMGSDDNSLAKRAVRALRAHKHWLTKKSWIEDGSLRGADLRDANLSNCDLHKADLEGAFMENAELEEANLSDSNMKGSDLSLANLKDAVLRRSDLRGADLGDADLRYADLTGAQVEISQLQTADLEGATLPNGERAV